MFIWHKTKFTHSAQAIVVSETSILCFRTAQTSLGTVIGQKESFTLGSAPINYYSYRGIKYATATRFKVSTSNCSCV